MSITLKSRSGNTEVTLTDEQWSAMQLRFGALAKQQALTWAGMRRTHTEERARGYVRDEATIEQRAYAIAAVRHNQEKPCGYVNGLERVLMGARLSTGMELWAAGIVVSDHDRSQAEREDRELWEFACRDINADPLAYYGVEAANV